MTENDTTNTDELWLIEDEEGAVYPEAGQIAYWRAVQEGMSEDEAMYACQQATIRALTGPWDYSAVPDEELAERVNAIGKRNEKMAQRIGRGEPPMGLDPQSMTAARLELLVAAIFPNGTRNRAEFELCWQETIVGPNLDRLSAAQRKASIEQGTPAARPKGLLLPGR